jgi:hypothetical protein
MNRFINTEKIYSKDGKSFSFLRITFTDNRNVDKIVNKEIVHSITKVTCKYLSRKTKNCRCFITHDREGGVIENYLAYKEKKLDITKLVKML